MTETVLSRVQYDRIRAMKSGNAQAVGTLRMLESALGNEAIAKRVPSLSDEAATTVIVREIKKRRDAVALYEQGNRPDLAATERAEITVLEPYLPPQLSADELRVIAVRIVAASGEKTLSGKVIGAMMKEVHGTADAAAVRTALEAVLTRPEA
jgi:uncharacterized protein YqeY